MPPLLRRPEIPLFALIIGIDEYANGSKLGGAVADAKAMKQFLEKHFRIPEANIVSLFNEKASRLAIIDAFRKLRDNELIEKGDPIVIYFSGHGCERPAPDAWGPGSRTQCLLPQDYKAVGTEPILDQAPIPDRAIGALLEDIAKEKGDNITLIFDCCHSASISRDQGREYEEYIPRTVHLDINIPETLDVDIWGGRSGSIPDHFTYHGIRSHVLLAACGEDEFAWEHKRLKRGQFTIALLETLEHCAVNKLGITYAEVIEKTQLKHPSMQRPQCVGLNRHRMLFNGKVSAYGEVYYPVCVDKGRTYVIGAGSAHGVSLGVKFTLCNGQKVKLGVVPVDETSSIQDFKTTVTTSLCLKDASFAKLTRIGTLPLYVEPVGNLASILEETIRGSGIDGYDANSPIFQPVEAEEAKLAVTMENHLLAFKILDQRVRSLGLTELPYKIAPDSPIVPHVLRSAAHYYRFLDLTREYDGAKQDVTVEFYLLNVEFDDYGVPFRVPAQDGLCQKDPNVIDFVVGSDAEYGMKITNNTPWELYLNVFQFNNSSLSIVPYYTQSSAGKPEIPLKKGGSFTIGYGPGGTAPFSYALRDNQNIDVGFLKLFFATRAIDMYNIELSSPFTNARAGNQNGGLEKIVTLLKAASKWISLIRDSPPDTWFTLDIPVVQRRYAAEV